MLFWYEKLKIVCIQHHFDLMYKTSHSLGEGAFA